MLETELTHYGVLGMKWGVRKNPERAYSKASSKVGKLKKKASKLEVRADRVNVKLNRAKKRLSKANDENREERQSEVDRLQEARDSKASRSKQASDKYKSWSKSMDKTFGKINFDDIPDDDIDAGKDYVNYILALQTNSRFNDYLRKAR